jgi:hypothetical protein
VQYTTKLKFNNSDEDDVFGLSTSDKPNTSSPSKFELSPAWSTLLQSDELDNKVASTTTAAWSTVLQSDGLENKAASTTTASLSELDGAYDLFSLPSDSSLAAHSQRLSRDDLSSTGNSTKSSGALDRLPSRDDLSYMSMSTSSIQQPRRRKVSFDNTVTAATIPSRQSYSSRIKARMWSNPEEQYTNAMRNDLEYTFDGKDWRTAKEENEFLRCSLSSGGSSTTSFEELLVHPVHLSPTPQRRVASLSAQINEDSNQRDQGYSSGDVFEMD